MTYILALNCGSSSIKSKLYKLPVNEHPQPEASLSISNIGSHDDRIQVKLGWTGEGRNVDEDGEQGDSVEYQDLLPRIVESYTANSSLKSSDIKYIVHRVVHGGTHDKPISITRQHTEGLKEMDKLSEFAPLHNHHAVLAVQACLNALPDHTSLLVFDTLFHQTIPRATRLYALPPADQDVKMPLQKYGFHGLSYASIVSSMARHLGKREDQINIVVAHLGSGASACCIKGGKSLDTSMGLTPLEGLIGGTRSGTIDPTAIFHHTPDAASDAGIHGMHVTKAEAILNKESGLKALAGTSNFATITDGKGTDERLQLAYDVYLDRLMGYISQYLFRLLSQLPLDAIDGLVFSGGIGEKSAVLHQDVLGRLGWLGTEYQRGNGGDVASITTPDSALKAWVVATDEEGYAVQLAKRELQI